MPSESIALLFSMQFSIGSMMNSGNIDGKLSSGGACISREKPEGARDQSWQREIQTAQKIVRVINKSLRSNQKISQLLSGNSRGLIHTFNALGSP